MFRQLLGVNGISPKGALASCHARRPEDLHLAVMTGDAKAIPMHRAIPGQRRHSGSFSI